MSTERLRALCVASHLEWGRIEAIAEELIVRTSALGLRMTPLVAGFDLNGPLVASTDATMAPYPGSGEILNVLAETEGVIAALVTGWDAATTRHVAEVGLHAPGLCIVAEKGAVAHLDGSLHHLVEHSEEDVDGFGDAVIRIAATRHLQIAVQPNASSACQCVYFEGFQRGSLKFHPLVSRASLDEQLAAGVEGALAGSVDARMESGQVFLGHVAARSVFRAMRRYWPLLPFRVHEEARGWKLQLALDDNVQFRLADVEAIGREIGEATRYIPSLNKDFSIDFQERLGGQLQQHSKESGARAIGELKFGTPFLLTNVGDKEDDALRGPGTVFFPQLGQRAMTAARNIDLPVVDGREYALVLLRAIQMERGI